MGLHSRDRRIDGGRSVDHQPDNPPSANWRRNFYILWASQLVAMLAFGAALPFLPLYIRHLGVEDTREQAIWAGALASSAAIAMAVMAPVWGSLSDRHGRKVMIERAMLGGAVFVGAMGLVHNVQQLLVLRLAQGTVSGTVTAARTLVASIAPRRQLGSALGMMQMAAFVGSSGGPLVGGFVADHFGYRSAFAVTAGLLFASGASVALFVQERFAPPEAGGKRPPGLFENVRLVTGTPQLAAMVVVLFAVQVGGMVVSPILPLFIQSLTGSGEQVASTAGMILGATAGASALSAVVVGRISDRVGYRPVLAVCAIGAGVLYAPQMLVTSPYQLLALRVAMGAFSGGVLPSAMAIIGLASPPESRGWVYGLTASASSLGNAVGPLLGATVAASLGLRDVFAVTAVIMTAVGIWVASVVREPLPTSEGEPVR